MAKQISVREIRLIAADDVGPLSGTIQVDVSNTDDAGVTALGMSTKRDVRAVYLPRASLNNLLNALRRPNTDTFPDGVIVFPVAKDP